jgi:hypothetical protein
MQFKSDHVAILQRILEEQVQFIVAFDELTEVGYKLKAINERLLTLRWHKCILLFSKDEEYE